MCDLFYFKHLECSTVVPYSGRMSFMSQGVVVIE